jgi:hypothetical protein
VTAIKKFIEHIDQLVFWLKENPFTPLPLQEKNRAIAILNKIGNAAELSDEEWEKLKQKQQPIDRPHIINIWPNFRQQIMSSTKTIEKVSEVSEKILLPLKMPQKKVSTNNFANKQRRELETCPDCKCSVLKKNLSKHRRKCKPTKQKSKNQLQTDKNDSGTISEKVQKNISHKEEKRLDGSSGFHQFRENGRFGSHSSFDNMGDDAHP